MALIVQDDTGQVADANSYIDVAFFTSYHDDRGNDTSGLDQTTQIEPALVLATDYVDSKYLNDFIGSKIITGAIRQTTQWPRLDAVDKDGFDVSEMIPDVLKQVIAEYAINAINTSGGVSSLTDVSLDGRDRGIRRIKEKVDVIETDTEFHNFGKTSLTKDYPKPDMMIQTLLKFGSSGQILRA